MTERSTITILLADDHPLFREGVRATLERESGFKILADVGDGERALALIADHNPIVAVLDMNMPKLTGLQVARELKRKGGTTEIVFLTMFDDEDTLNEAMDLGVRGYILKDSAATDIVGAVRAVAEGKHYISPSLTGKLISRRDSQKAFSAQHAGIETLSDTERKILRLIAESKTSKEIAEALFLGQKTVENYRYKMCEKLGLSGAYSLLKFALENRNAVNRE